MKKVSNASIDYYILPNLMLCRVFGLSSTDREYSTRDKMFAYFQFAIVLTMAFSILIPQILLIAYKWGDPKIVAGVGCVLISGAQLIFKMVYLMARRKKTYKLYKEIRSLWDSSDDRLERQSYEGFAYRARMITISLFSIGMWMVTIYIVITVFSYFVEQENRQLPIDAWYGTDVSQTPCYETMAVYQLLVSTISCIGFWGIETSCMTGILHICGQFQLIKTWISKIGVVMNSQSLDPCRNYAPKIKADLIRCVRHHQRIISVIKDLNNLLTPIAFMQIFTSGIEICLSGFTAVSNDSGRELVSSIVYFIVMMSQLLLWCWPGEILIQESLEVGKVAYLNIPWYKLPPTYQRQLLLMILRSQNSCSMSALTFDSLSFCTLTSVFNTASSYFALLRQMQAS